MKISNILIASIILFIGCKTPQVVEQKRTVPLSDIEILKAFMTGSFTSGNQAKKDSSFYDISLHMYPIWRSKKGNWLYVEQALTQNRQKPYRQRLYQLEQVNSTEFISRVYTLENPDKFIGKWNQPLFFDRFDEKIITERIGCEVYLKKKSDRLFVGGTQGKGCKSTMRGASYATSEVEISISGITSWDRGFDAEGNQVWGAEKGGYVFKK